MGQHGKYGPLVRRIFVLITLAAVLAPAPALACRLALALAVDVSASVDEGEHQIQRQGLAAALLADEVQSAFFAAPEPVALSVYEWSGQSSHSIVADWTMIASAEDLLQVAALLAREPEAPELQPTAIGHALRYGAQMMQSAPECWSKTIDVSGDGISNDGYPPEVAYRHFPLDGVTVNGLVIGGAEDIEHLRRYFYQEVIRGPGAFVMVAQNYQDFEKAMRRKLEREVAPRAVGLLGKP